MSETGVRTGWNTEAELSALLFRAREAVAMYGDVLASVIGSRDPETDELRDELDAYRARRGWSPNGYGGEKGPPVAP